MNIFNRKKRENVIIVGCGFTGAKLASILVARYDNITVIDLHEKSFSALSHSSDFSLFAGDATDTDVLENAGIKIADMIIITTNDDNANIMIAKIAKDYYKVHKIIACIKDTSKEFAYKQIGIDVISPIILLINEIQNLLSKESEV